MSYPSPMARPGTAETTRPSPATGAMASSTPVISSSVAPAASARVTLHSRQAAGAPVAATAATRASSAVLASRRWAPGRPSPSPACCSTALSSMIASLRNVSWYLAAGSMRLPISSGTIPPRAGAGSIPPIVVNPSSSLQQSQLTGPRDRLVPGGDAQLAVGRPHLRLDGVRRQEQLPGDLRGRQVRGQQRQQPELGGGQRRGCDGGAAFRG